MKNRRLAATLAFDLAVAALAAGCNTGLASDDGGAPGNGAIGSTCGADTDCGSGKCAPLPGGYCSSDCSKKPCTDGVCKTVQGKPLCLVACQSAADCRAPDYQCFQGACVPACAADKDCGAGRMCTGGQCVLAMAPGKKALDQPCKADPDCQSSLCDRASATCKFGCLTDADCDGVLTAPATCFVNPYDSNHDNATDAIQPICIKRRGGKAPGASCAADKECDLGQCELGVCVNLCQGGGCANGLACVGMIAQVDSGGPRINACLLRAGVLTFDLAHVGLAGPVGIPTNAVGFNIFVAAKNQDITFYTGITDLEDPAGTALYTPPMSRADVLALPIRYEPTEGTSMVLVTNNPETVKVMPGQYAFGTFAQTAQGKASDFGAQIRIKLADAFPKTGTIPLHIFMTNLQGGCTTLNMGNAQQALAGPIAQIKQIYAQVGVTIDPVKIIASNAASSFVQPAMGLDAPLDDLLRTATDGDTPDVLELVLVKTIGGGGDPNFEVLGISGGIPASTGIPGTVHSGATASLSSLCFDKTGKSFASTIAHELAHGLGLFHNIEQDGSTDPIADDDADRKANLMYWEEDSGQHLTPMQGRVILSNPAVH